MTGWLIGGIAFAVLLVIHVRRPLKSASIAIDTAFKEVLASPNWGVTEAHALIEQLDNWARRGIPEQQQVDWLRIMHSRGELPPELGCENITPRAVREAANEILQRCDS